MTWLPDSTVDHLRGVVDLPDLSGGKYELIGRIGKGGMGVVYRVRDRDLDREVALKVISTPGPIGQDAERMWREARVLARLDHPGIVPVHDVGTLPDGRTFYVMKLIAGTPLDQYATRAPALAELLRIFERVCEAVAFAHSQRVIHRDLKPANILVGAFGEVSVMDWGLAKVVDGADPPTSGATRREGLLSDPTVTADGTVAGTPGYMAPEQASGAVSLLDERTDVYALGAILHFLLTGRDPPPGVVPESGIDIAVPRPLKAICFRAQNPMAERRYATAGELGAASFPDASGKHYYWQIMLPGSILGIIVGYATQKHMGKAPAQRPT